MAEPCREISNRCIPLPSLLIGFYSLVFTCSPGTIPTSPEINVSWAVCLVLGCFQLMLAEKLRECLGKWQHLHHRLCLASSDWTALKSVCLLSRIFILTSAPLNGMLLPPAPSSDKALGWQLSHTMALEDAFPFHKCLLFMVSVPFGTHQGDQDCAPTFVEFTGTVIDTSLL